VRALSPLDAGFLYAESGRTPMHMGSIGIFEGAPLRDEHGALRIDALRAEIESRLHLVPKLRRRVRFTTLGMAAPVWVDDPAFDIANHVRTAALPSPGTEASLRDLCAGLMARPLQRDRPLWEIWAIDGLEGGRVAMMEKLHHSMADGLAGVELVTVLFDLDRHPPRGESVSCVTRWVLVVTLPTTSPRSAASSHRGASPPPSRSTSRLVGVGRWRLFVSPLTTCTNLPGTSRLRSTISS
jgi:WS/DGAT/MGAT family acyltransferase